MRTDRKYGMRINLPSTAQIIHELRMMEALDRVRLALSEAAAAQRRERIEVLQALLVTPDVHDTPSPEMGMERLRRGSREQELLRLLYPRG